MDNIKDQVRLNQRLERIEEALMKAGLLPRPTVLEKVQPERVQCRIVSEATVVGVQWGQNTKAKYTAAVIRVRHCDKDEDYTIDAFDGFGDYKVQCAECKATLVADVRWVVKK
jgi:hypothetical protein